MADEGSVDGDTTIGRVKARVTHALGWATGDREVEAKGQVQLDEAERAAKAADPPDHAPGSDHDRSAGQPTDPGDEPERAIADAERQVRQAHQELPPD